MTVKIATMMGMGAVMLVLGGCGSTMESRAATGAATGFLLGGPVGAAVGGAAGAAVNEVEESQDDPDDSIFK